MNVYNIFKKLIVFFALLLYGSLKMHAYACIFKRLFLILYGKFFAFRQKTIEKIYANAYICVYFFDRNRFVNLGACTFLFSKHNIYLYSAY